MDFFTSYLGKTLMSWRDSGPKPQGIYVIAEENNMPIIISLHSFCNRYESIDAQSVALGVTWRLRMVYIYRQKVNTPSRKYKA